MIRGSSVLLLICLTYVLVTSASCYEIPNQVTVEVLQPKGFRISIPDEPGTNLAAFHGNINRPTRGQEEGDYNGDMRKISGRWVYENKQKKVRQTDTLYYWLFVLHNGVMYKKLDRSVTFDGSSMVPVPVPVVTTTSPRPCSPSKTIVKGQTVCQGQLIFEDNFDTLDYSKWKKDIRLPSELDDADFVSYQNRPENCYVSDGRLYIVPNLLAEVPGFSDRKIRTSKLDLGSECTAVVDTENECRRLARLYRILPPVISARIKSKDSFSFLYGKVEIRAKLPRGDWVFPQIFLEPLTNDYGISGYASGQMRIAFIRGNEVLESSDRTSLSGSQLFGGVVLSPNSDLRNVWMKTVRGSDHFGSDFHTYSMVWTDQSVSFAVDGETYALIPGNFKTAHSTHNVSHAQLWENGEFMAPFDKEFFITLGVSAGGLGDFPDNCRTGTDNRLKPWLNTSPKAELKFWQDRYSWYSTWGGVKAGVQVDYIKVWAL